MSAIMIFLANLVFVVILVLALLMTGVIGLPLDFFSRISKLVRKVTDQQRFL
jgi:hypothetical protein